MQIKMCLKRSNFIVSIPQVFHFAQNSAADFSLLHISIFISSENMCKQYSIPVEYVNRIFFNGHQT